MNEFESIKVIFNQPIAELDKFFKRKEENWGVSSLKEWIDTYRATRFTKISENSAIITSEYEMENAKGSLIRFGFVEKVEVLD